MDAKKPPGRLRKNKNQRRARNKQLKRLEEQLAVASQAATPLTQPTAVQEAPLPTSDGGPEIAPTVPNIVDRAPFPPITSAANNNGIARLESNTHGNVHGSPLSRSVGGAQETGTGAATMATTSGVTKVKRKTWKHRKSKKGVNEKDATRINPNESSSAQAESSKNQTGLPGLKSNKGKAKAVTQTLSQYRASKARARSGGLIAPTDARSADWQEFAQSTAGDKRTESGSGAVRFPRPTEACPVSKKRKGKEKAGPIPKKGKGKGRGKGKEGAINEAADKLSDRHDLNDAQGSLLPSARLATLPISSIPFTTPNQNHHPSTTQETGQPTATAQDSESLVSTQGNMPASTRASSVDHYSTRSTHASRQFGVQLEKFDAPPAERNTRGFQPAYHSQVNQQPPNLPTSASTVQPRSTTSIPVGIAKDSTIITAPTTVVTSRGADVDIVPALRHETQNAKVNVPQSGTGRSRIQVLNPPQQAKQAAAVKASEHDELYSASDENPPTSHSRAAQPTKMQKGSIGPAARHTDNVNSARTSIKGTNIQNGLLGPNQSALGSRLTGQNARRVVPEDEAGKPNRDSGSSKDVIYLTPMPAAMPHINLNALPQYAWNKGINPKYQKNSCATQQATAFVASKKEPAPSGIETDDTISAKRSSRHVEQGRDNDVNEASFTSERGSKLVTSTGPAEPLGEDNHAAHAKHASVGVQTMMAQPRKAYTEAMHYTPPHLRVPKPKPDPSRPSTAATQTPPTISPEDNGTPSHGVSPSTTAITQSRDVVKASETVEPDHSHLPPHMRPPKGKKPGQTEPNADPISHSAVGNNNCAGKEVAPAKTTTASVAQPYANSKERVSPSTDEEKQIIRGSAPNISRDLSDTTRRRVRMEKMMRDKGYSPPPKGRIPIIGGWATAERTWEERDPHDYDAPEHQSHLHEWSGRIAQEIGEEPIVVDTAAPGFTLGTYVPVEGRLESAVSEDAHETYRLDDPYTERKANQTAQAAIEAMMKKKEAEEPPQPKPTKAQKREAFENQQERKRHYLEMERNHPNKPIADIYIRPAEEKDLGAIAEIFNWYIKNTAATLEIQPKTVRTMRFVMEETREEGFDMYVAVQRSGRSGANGHNHRVVSEPICGFTFANDIAGQNHGYIYTAELFVYASHDHPHVGIGRCLFDRMMCCLDINYATKGGCEWRGQELLTRREVKKVMVNIPYWEKVDADLEDLLWKGNWLTGITEKYFMKFIYQGTLSEIGWKQKKTVSVAQFLHDTLVDISRKPDNIE